MTRQPQMLVLAIMLVSLVTPVTSISVPICNKDWFGTECEYQCHCQNDMCDNSGACKMGYTCQKGWFGPECQYKDLVVDSDAPGWLNDNDDSTCNDEHEHNRMLTLNLKISLQDFWMRYTIKRKKFQSLEIEFYDMGVNVPCKNRTSVLINPQTMEVHCLPLTMPVTIITLRGLDLASLCSMHVSGGRNMALKQKSLLSFDEETESAMLAVDGNETQTLCPLNCAYTANNNSDVHIHVMFSAPSKIQRLVILNCLDPDVNNNNLGGLELTSLGPNGKPVFTYNDDKSEAQSSYYIVHPLHLLVNAFKIRSTGTSNSSSNSIAICEFLAFGDIACPDLKNYGRNCDLPCNCNNDNCFPPTGSCFHGCPKGYAYLGCTTKCTNGTFGKDCASECNTCQGEKCESVNGHCLVNCAAGYSGFPFCKEECPNGTYGVNCALKCFDKCLDNQCHPVTGTCLEGCEIGYQGDLCNQTCDSGYWGDECNFTCPEICTSGICDHLLGTCSHGCAAGYTGVKCDQRCSPGMYGENCTRTCPGSCPIQCNPIDGHCANPVEDDAVHKQKVHSRIIYLTLGATCFVIGLISAFILCTKEKTNSAAGARTTRCEQEGNTRESSVISDIFQK